MVRSKNQVVIGLGFGDEGKGLTTSYLMSQIQREANYQSNQTILNCRFNGGQQAGHTVYYNGQSHIFSQLGAASFQGAVTYISRFCTFSPRDFINEHNIFLYKIPSRGWDLRYSLPIVIIDPLCKITTPFDVIRNRDSKENVLNGTVGSGFGMTIDRHENDNYKIFAKDLLHPKILREKLKSISLYYNFHNADGLIDDFIHDTEMVTKNFFVHIYNIPLNGKNSQMLNFKCLYKKYVDTNTYVLFEGAQGVLLDMEHGFFPNVTRSKTTIANVLELIGDSEEYDITFVTRTYQTRHGNGFMTNEDKPPKLKNNERETNISHEFQGNFRTAEIDKELLNYAIQSVYADMKGHLPKNVNLMITCNDQLKINTERFISLFTGIEFDEIYLSYGPSAADVEKYKGKNS